MSTNRDDAFNKGNQRRQEEREKEANRKKGSYNFEEIVFTALELDKYKVVRLLGWPLDNVNNIDDPYSSKEILFSMITGDDDKPFRCIWPMGEDGENWILWRIYNIVLDYLWERKEKNDKAEKIYKHKIKHPEIFYRVFKNGKRDNSYEKGWKPSSAVLMNILDRHDADWHKENKHTKLLSRKVAYYNDKPWYDVGIPKYLYNSIWDSVVELKGDWENYDILIKKLSDNPWYIAVSPSEPVKNPDIASIIDKYVIDGPVTDEELSWERYNVAKLYKVTSYQKMKKKLGNFIRRIDDVFDKSYYDELVALAEKEIKDSVPDFNPEELEKEAKEHTQVVVEEKVPSEETKPVEQSVKTRAAKKDFDVGTIDASIYKGITNLNDTELKVIIGAKDSGEFIYQGDKAECECSECGFLSPEDFTYCPKCGCKFV